MSTKYNAVAAALASVGAMMNKLNNTYGALNSQDADFKNLKVEVDSALALPEDPTAGELAPQFTVMSQDQVDAVVARVVYHMPQATDTAGIIAAVAGHIENSDVEIMAAIADTRAELLAAAKA